MAKRKQTLSTEPYKGVRDFYPEDMATEKRLFSVMRRAAESFGYEEYGASILEPTELYASKTSDEIVNEQTYTFVDRGDRSVTLRPEMTPTLARMVAAKRRELGFPLRWYSIPNVFRYERPQRGRLREHWQLNCDLFGISGIDAEVEIITLAHRIMLDFGASTGDFFIRIGSRSAIRNMLERKGIGEDNTKSFFRFLDQRNKMAAEEFEQGLGQFKLSLADFSSAEGQGEDVYSVVQGLEARGISNVLIDLSIVRGFDYYTGIVFEIFDANPENKRSLFGGGRYDNLLAVFGEEPIPAVGFGMGDVTIRDFLETRGLLPGYRSTTDLYICAADDAGAQYGAELAEKLRAEGLNIVVDTTGRSLGDQKKTAVKQSIPFVAYLRERDRSTGVVPIEGTDGSEQSLPINKLAEFLHAKRA